MSTGSKVAMAAAVPKTPASMTAGELVGVATPLPWRAVNGIDRWRVENGEFYVCAMADNGKCGEIDAELIVRAVNSFAAMREALEAYVDSSADSPHTIDDARAMAEKALALANNTGH